MVSSKHGVMLVHLYPYFCIIILYSFMLKVTCSKNFIWNDLNIYFCITSSHETFDLSNFLINPSCDAHSTLFYACPNHLKSVFTLIINRSYFDHRFNIITSQSLLYYFTMNTSYHSHAYHIARLLVISFLLNTQIHINSLSGYNL